MGNFSRIGVFLLITAGIIAYLQTGAGLFQKVKNSGLRIQLNSLDRALELYRQQKRRYPKDFSAFVRSEFGGDSNSDPSKDPWGNYYFFKRISGGFDLSSAGPDGQFGTDDDVVWRRQHSQAGLVQEKAQMPKAQVSTLPSGQSHDDPLLAQIERRVEDRVALAQALDEKELNRLLTQLLEQSWFE